MKDYIDKLRNDYHQRKLKKLAFGDKFKDLGNNLIASYNDLRFGIDKDEDKKPKLTNQQMGLVNNDVSYNPNITLPKAGVTTFQLGQKPDLSSTGTNSGKNNKPLSNYDMGLVNVDRDVIYSPTPEGERAKLIDQTQEDLKTRFTIPGQESTYDGKQAPSFIKKDDTKKEEKTTSQQQGFPFLPPQGDLTTNLYNLGRAIGAKKGTKGRGLSIVGNAGAAALEGARAVFSGVGFSKAQQYTDQYNQDQMIAARKKYESNPQYKNTNYTGGQTQARIGGKISHFEEGGEQQQIDPRMEQMMAQQQQMDPRMQEQQEGQMNEQEAQAYQQIAEKLVNSFETIEEIADYLNENKVDEVAFNAIMRFAQDMIEDRDESSEDNEEATEEPEGEKEGEMRKGGKKFNKKVGEYIEFEYDGKVHKGTIKSIKNGQIFLK